MYLCRMKKIIFLTLIALTSYSCKKDISKFQYEVHATSAKTMVNYYNSAHERVDTIIDQNIFKYKWSEQYNHRRLAISAYTIAQGGAIVNLYRDGDLIDSDTCVGIYQVASIVYN